MFPKIAYISDAMRVASTLSRRGDKRPDDVDLGTPTLVLNSAMQSQLSPLFFIRSWKPHGPYRHHLPERSRLSTIMTENSAPVRDITTPSDEFRAVVKSAGMELKERLLDKRNTATKGYAFDSHAIQPFMDILEPVLCHKVSGNDLRAK
jgi:hypothetical protein